MGWLFLFFSELLSNKKNRPKERSDRGPFFDRQLRELYEADSQKPGIYGSQGVWANALGLFARAPSRGGRGRRAAVNIVVCLERGVFICVFLCVCLCVFFFLNQTHTDYYKYEATSFLIGTSTIKIVLIARAVRGRFPVNRDLRKRECMSLRVGRVPSHAVSSCTRWPGCCGIHCVFRMGRNLPCFFSDSFSSNAHGLLQV